MLKIGDFSKLSRISVRMLRYYDDMGLIMPKSVDDYTGYRYYSEEQLPIAARITVLKNMGFSLLTIAEILKNYEDAEKLTGFLEVRRTELLEELTKLDDHRSLIDSAIKHLREDGEIMKYDVILKEFDKRVVASVRKVIPSYNKEGMLWQTLMQETAPLDMKDGTPCYTLAIFHDADFRENDVDVEVQKTVKGEYQNTENVIFKTEPAVLIASATYKGSYEKVGEVNMAVANWVKENGYDFNGPMFNIYYVSPHETQNPDEFVTEVCYPVRKK